MTTLVGSEPLDDETIAKLASASGSSVEHVRSLLELPATAAASAMRTRDARVFAVRHTTT